VSVRLFTLGVIFSKDSHGYELKEVAQLWGLPRWADIQEGSIYHALTKLKAEGLIEESRVEQSGNNRTRTIYRITEQGQEAFLKLLRETCRNAPVEKRDIDIALAFLDFLPPEERVALIQERQDTLHKTHAEMLERQQNTRHLYPDLHPWVEAGVQHSLGRIAFEIEWNRSLLNIVGAWPHRKRG
jgi:DNA-binding PadR family transcriptional regulator